MSNKTEWIKVIASMITAAIVAWKLREHRKELKGLHDELIEAKDEAIDLGARVAVDDMHNQPASVRRRTILIKAAAIAGKVTGE